ncbi:MAG: HlyD family efflux transporter periplasmic adaptor subunit [Gammaproteobacteria bacterium]|nr:HlyD family efflux transporter periplasmic adaptor subunit [Gammaproteobacteria bacterium]MBT4193258.1 HlyD family efflux transporter periplasmic adaptor subunit [Gammaproteobacteria bacterium]MBT4450714.1 HlyD family efflux transporter periplasmic adaptor subunit [Gammaproteobacteria bacterium]MBT4861808.1 HlyD family efflux transporter periplasmic adaptor subunit [Gammaproteobacteria bacterium]MBT6457402.1 HlyD family efflux transporter periplasmic adaptor subunit [Gammaproteobacteria bact
MKTELFRQQVIDKQKASQFGSVMIINPLSFKVLSLISTLIILTLLSFVVWGEYTRKQSVTGLLTPDSGLITLYATKSGIVSKCNVKQEQLVTNKTNLLIISTQNNSSTSENLQSQLLQKIGLERMFLELRHKKTVDLLEQQKESIRNKIEMLGRQLKKSSKQLVLENKILASINNEMKRTELLAQKNLISKSSFDLNQQVVLQQKAKIIDLNNSIELLENQLLQLPADISILELQYEQQKFDYNRELNNLEKNEISLLAEQYYAVRTEVNSIVTHVLVKEGQFVNAGQPLLTLRPENSDLNAELFIPSHSIGLIEVGQSVMLRYDAFPYERYGTFKGELQNVSQSVIAPGQTGNVQMASSPVYQATVKLDQQYVSAYGRQIKLTPEMTLSADIQLDTVPLYRLVLEPIYRTTGKLF